MVRWTTGLLLVVACAGRPRDAPSAEPDTMATSPAAANKPTARPAPAIEPEPEEPAPPAEADDHAAQDPYPPPLTEEHKALFWGSKEDPPAEHRGGVTPREADKRYLAGNEKTLYAFYEDIKDLGGGYVGVGSDQAYLFIGWAKPELAWLVDYDEAVVTIHGVYRSFFLDKDTPQELVALWGKGGFEDGTAAIDAQNPPARAKKLKRLYGRHKGWINRRVQHQLKRMAEAKIPSFWTDQEQYDYIRELYRRERIRPMLANLLESKGLKGVAQAAKELDVPVRIFYVSNAEQYWNGYTRQFRANVQALPVDDKSILLRTLLIWDVNGDYRYNVQPLANYQDWLTYPFVRSVYHIVHKRPKADPAVVNKLYTDSDPKASPVARRAEMNG
jgi:hypothetical protein